MTNSVPGTNKVTWTGHRRHLPIGDPDRTNPSFGAPELRPVPQRRTRASMERHAQEYADLLAVSTVRAERHYKKHGQGLLDPFTKLLTCYMIIPLVGSMHAV